MSRECRFEYKEFLALWRRADVPATEASVRAQEVPAEPSRVPPLPIAATRTESGIFRTRANAAWAG